MTHRKDERLAYVVVQKSKRSQLSLPHVLFQSNHLTTTTQTVAVVAAAPPSTRGTFVWARFVLFFFLLILHLDTCACTPLQLFSTLLQSPLLLLSSSTAVNCTNRHSPDYDPLVCWLQSFQLDIPDQTFKAGFARVSIHGLKCGNFTLHGGLPSSSSSQQEQQQSLLQINVTSVSGACHGSYHTTGGIGGDVSAQLVTDNVADDVPALAWSLQVISTNVDNTTTTTNFTLPHAIQTVQCDTNLAISKLHFSNSISAKVLDLVKHQIQSYITQELNHQLCPLLKQQVDTKATQFIQDTLLPWIQPYLHNESQPIIIINATTTNNNHKTDNKNDNYETYSRIQPTIQKESEHVQDHTSASFRNLLFFKDTTNNNNNNNNNNKNNNNNNNNHHNHTDDYDDNKRPALLSFVKDTPLFLSSLHGLNDFLHQFLNEGFLKHYGWKQPQQPQQQQYYHHDNDNNNSSHCGFFFDGVNGVLESLLTNTDLFPNHALEIPMDTTFHFNISSSSSTSFLTKNETTTISIQLHKLSFQGIYHWDQLNILRPVTVATSNNEAGNNPEFRTVLQQQSEDDNVTMTVAASITVAAAVMAEEEEQQEPLKESFVLQFTTSSLNAVLQLAVQMEQEKFDNLTINTIVRSHGQCLLQSVLSLSIREMSAMLQLQEISIIPVETTSKDSTTMSNNNNNGLERDIDQLVNNILHLFLHQYQPAITQVIYALSSSQKIQTAVNQLLKEFITNNKHKKKQTNDTDCTPSLSSSSLRPKEEDEDEEDGYRFVNFTTDLPFLHRLNSVLNHTHTLTKINQYLECTSHYLDDQLLPVSSFFNHYYDLPRMLGKNNNSSSSKNHSSALPLFRLRSFRIDHAGSLQAVQLLDPIMDGLHLQNTLDFGSKRSNSSDDSLYHPSSKPQLLVSFDLDYQESINLTASVNLTISLDEFLFRGISFLQYDLNRLWPMRIQGLLSNHGIQCLSYPLRTLTLFQSNSKDHQSTARIVEQNSDNLRFALDTTLNATIHCPGSATLDGFSVSLDSDNHPVIQRAITSSYTWAVQSISDILDAVALSHTGGMKTCERGPEIPNIEPESLNKDTRKMILTVLIVFTIAQVLFLVLLTYARKREIENELEVAQVEIPEEEVVQVEVPNLTQPLLEPDQIYLEDPSVMLQDERPKESHERKVETPTALIFSKYVPELSKYMIPMLIVAVITLLLSSNLGVGATVDMTVSLQDEIYRIPPLFSFSLVNTATEMWDAGIYPLLFLVVVFSGIWPYVKLLSMFWCWTISPQSALQVKRRGSILLTLDALGKFSLVDTYVLVLMLVAFRYHLPLSEDTILDVYVTPNYGFYGFLIATSASMAIGHVLVFYNRRADLKAIFSRRNIRNNALLSARQKLFTHKFRISEEERSGVRLSWPFVAMLVFAWLAITILLGIGISRKSFVFEFGGLAGVALGDAKRSEYSLLSLGVALPRSVAFSAGLGIVLLQLVYFFYAVVTPFACLLFLFILAFVPLNLQRQLQILTLAEIANAWSAIEVFALSIVAALLEISTFASFIIGHRCDFINEILKEYNDNRDSSEGTVIVDSCYSVTASVSEDVLILVVGVILNSCWVSFVLRLAHLSMDERIQEIRLQRLICDERNSTGDEETHSFVQDLSSSTWTSWMFFEESTTLNEPGDQNYDEPNGTQTNGTVNGDSLEPNSTEQEPH